MKLEIISFGKIKNKELAELMDYYARLSGKYLDIQFRQLKDKDGKITLPDISKQLESAEFLCALSEEGREFSTMEFASKLQRWKLDGVKVSFLIGNAFGLDKGILDRADLQLSLSKMTFPHEFTQVLLLEQIYRASNHLAGGKYHK